MITAILGTVGVIFCAHQVVKQVDHKRMMDDFHEWMETEFNDTFDKFTKERREYYETGEGKSIIEDFKKETKKF